MPDYIDFTIEEYVAASDLLGLDPPALLFEHVRAPDAAVVEQIVAAGQRFLKVRGLLSTTNEGTELDEVLARSAELLDRATLVVVVMGVGREISFNWLLAGPDLLAVLSAMGEGIWRTRMFRPEELTGAIGLLGDLDLGWGAAQSAEAVEFDIAALIESQEKPVDFDADSLRRSIEGLPEELHRSVEAVIGEQAEFHSVGSVRRDGAGGTVRSTTCWSSHPQNGGHLIELDGVTLRLTPRTPDQIVELIVEGLQA